MASGPITSWQIEGKKVKAETDFIFLDAKISAAAAAAKSLQSCPTLCDPIDGSPPGSSIYGIFQARVLEWGAIAFSENHCSRHEIKDVCSLEGKL